MGSLPSCFTRECFRYLEGQSIYYSGVIFNSSSTRNFGLDDPRVPLAGGPSLVSRIAITGFDSIEKRIGATKSCGYLVLSLSNELVTNGVTGGSRSSGVCDCLVLFLQVDQSSDVLATIHQMVFSKETTSNGGKLSMFRFLSLYMDVLSFVTTGLWVLG